MSLKWKAVTAYCMIGITICTFGPSTAMRAQQQQNSSGPVGYIGVGLGEGQQPGTVAVVSVGADSPAEKAGLKAGDILLKVGNADVKNVPEFTQAVAGLKPGTEIVFHVRRDAKEIDVPVLIGTRPAPVTEQYPPEVKIQSEDYATARAHFKTKLTRQGPSPQPSKLVAPPAGVTEVEYQSGDLRLKAWISKPLDEKKKQPAVLFCHGGFGFDYPDDWNVSQPYRDAGYIVLTPILRGEDGQPGAFSFFYNEVDDVLAAADYLSKLPYVDTTHIYIAGPSAGGTVALLAAMTSNRFRAAASFSATPDQVLLARHAKYAERDIPLDLTNVHELEMRSPLAYAASLKCPTRFYVGSEEPEFQETTGLMAKLAKEHGIDAEAIINEGDHNSSVAPGVKKSIEFFKAI